MLAKWSYKLIYPVFSYLCWGISSLLALLWASVFLELRSIFTFILINGWHLIDLSRFHNGIRNTSPVFIAFFVLFPLKPGSRMAPTYLGNNRRHGLGQRCGICEHLSPTYNLSEALTTGLPGKLNSAQLRRQTGDQCLGQIIYRR